MNFFRDIVNSVWERFSMAFDTLTREVSFNFSNGKANSLNESNFGRVSAFLMGCSDLIFESKSGDGNKTILCFCHRKRNDMT